MSCFGCPYAVFLSDWTVLCFSLALCSVSHWPCAVFLTGPVMCLSLALCSVSHWPCAVFLIGLVLCLSLALCNVSDWPCAVVPVLQVGYNSLGPEGTLALLVGVERNECSSLTLLNFGVSHGQASRETNRCRTIDGLALLFPL